jgi:hypothetical protein
MVSFIADEVNPTPGAKAAVALRGGRNLLVACDDKVRAARRDSIERGVLREDFANWSSASYDAQGLFDTLVDLAAKNVSWSEIQAGVGVRGGRGDFEGTDTNDCLAITDRNDDEFGIRAAAQGFRKAGECFGLARPKPLGCGGNAQSDSVTQGC